MSFTRANPGGWAVGDKITSTQQNNLDIDHANAVDKTGDTITGNVHVGGTGSLTIDAGGLLTSTAGSVILATAHITSLEADQITPVTTNGPIVIGETLTLAYQKYVAWQGTANTQAQLNQTVFGVVHTTSVATTQILSVAIPNNTVAMCNLVVSAKDLTGLVNVAGISLDILVVNSGGGIGAITTHSVSSVSNGVSPLSSVTVTSSVANLLVSVIASSTNSIDWQAKLTMSLN